MKQSFLAILVLIGSNIFYMFSFCLVKLLSPIVDTTVIMFFRFFAGPLYLIPFFIARKKSFSIKKPVCFAVRILSGLAAMFCLFKALKFGHVGNTMLIFELSVLWTVFYGYFVHKEKLSYATLAMIPVLFCGIWLIFKPTYSIGFIEFGLAEGYAFLASIFNMGVYVSLKQVRQENNNVTVVLVSYFFSMLAVSFFISPAALSIDLHSFLLLLLMCSIGFVGQMCMSYGFKFNQVGISSLFMLSSVPLYYLGGYIFFKEKMSLEGIFGVCLVVLSLGFISRHK